MSVRCRRTPWASFPTVSVRPPGGGRIDSIVHASFSWRMLSSARRPRAGGLESQSASTFSLPGRWCATMSCICSTSITIAADRLRWAPAENQALVLVHCCFSIDPGCPSPHLGRAAAWFCKAPWPGCFLRSEEVYDQPVLNHPALLLLWNESEAAYRPLFKLLYLLVLLLVPRAHMDRCLQTPLLANWPTNERLS